MVVVSLNGQRCDHFALPKGVLRTHRRFGAQLLRGWHAPSTSTADSRRWRAGLAQPPGPAASGRGPRRPTDGCRPAPAPLARSGGHRIGPLSLQRARAVSINSAEGARALTSSCWGMTRLHSPARAVEVRPRLVRRDMAVAGLNSADGAIFAQIRAQRESRIQRLHGCPSGGRSQSTRLLHPGRSGGASGMQSAAAAVPEVPARPHRRPRQPPPSCAKPAPRTDKSRARSWRIGALSPLLPWSILLSETVSEAPG